MSYDLPHRRGACLSSKMRQKSHNWFAFSTDVSGLINELDLVIKTKSSQSMFG